MVTAVALIEVTNEDARPLVVTTTGAFVNAVGKV